MVVEAAASTSSIAQNGTHSPPEFKFHKVEAGSLKSNALISVFQGFWSNGQRIQCAGNEEWLRVWTYKKV